MGAKLEHFICSGYEKGTFAVACKISADYSSFDLVSLRRHVAATVRVAAVLTTLSYF